jgi:WD40 repeat protein
MWVGKLPEKRASVLTAVFAPDGRTLYTGDNKGWVRAWDVVTRTHRNLFRRSESTASDRGVYHLWPTPDGSRLLVSDQRALWDALRPGGGSPLLTAPKESWGWWKYLLPDGKRFISCEPEYRLALWDLETGQRLKIPGTLGKASHITHYDLLPDGVTLLTFHTSTSSLPLWDFRTGRRVGELAPSKRGINPCSLSKDGGTFVVGRDTQLWVYDVPSRSLRHQLKFEKEFRELAFHPNGRLLASASTNSVLTLWDTTTGKQLTQLDGKLGKVQALAFSPDGLTCAAGAREALIVFDVDF